MIDTTVFQNKTAVYYTLGCKLNFSETSTIGKILREAGVRTARKGEKADICVVNTCSVTEMADKKCRQAIHRLVKQHPGAFVVVTGCYAQLKPGDVAKIDGVDVVLGAEQKENYFNIWATSKSMKKERLSLLQPKISVRFLPRVHGRPYPFLLEGAGWMRLLLVHIARFLCPRAKS